MVIKCSFEEKEFIQQNMCIEKTKMCCGKEILRGIEEFSKSYIPK